MPLKWDELVGDFEKMFGKSRQYFTRKEVADWFGVTGQTVVNWCTLDNPECRLNRCFLRNGEERYRRADILNYHVYLM